MSEKIDKTLKKIAAATSKASSPTSSNTEPLQTQPRSLGNPDCPICHGFGLVRQDLPVGHPDFGKIQPCTCRNTDVSQQVRSRLFSLSNLDKLSHLTFENFKPRGRVGLWPQQAASLERAFNTCQQFAQKLDSWLVLQGGYGCGKTHLAAAIANFAVSVGVPTLFLTVPDLLDSLRFAYSDQGAGFEERFEEIRNAQLLILDDFGTQNATPWAQEKLFQIINYRYINRMPLVVTTNLPLEDIEERMRSRLSDPDLGQVLRIMATDFRNPTGDMGHHELSSLSMHQARTFASFDLRKGEGLNTDEEKSLSNALAAAQDFARNPKGWLVLMGGYGSGKTHLAAAIANYRSDLGQPPLFVMVPDLLDHLRATFSPNSSVSLDRRFEEVRRAHLLILDDLGTQSMTPWVREKLYQLFTFRYNAELATVITTSDELEKLDPRLRSRMLDRRFCTIKAIIAPPYTGQPSPAKTRHHSRSSKNS